jgi:hypothetical protein
MAYLKVYHCLAQAPQLWSRPRGRCHCCSRQRTIDCLCHLSKSAREPPNAYSEAQGYASRIIPTSRASEEGLTYLPQRSGEIERVLSGHTSLPHRTDLYWCRRVLNIYLADSSLLSQQKLRGLVPQCVCRFAFVVRLRYVAQCRGRLPESLAQGPMTQPENALTALLRGGEWRGQFAALARC